jgi:shikimate kinase
MNLILIGQRASGKTSAGRALAASTGAPFLDTDQEVEKILGQSTAEIFAAGSEALFRETESRVADSLARIDEAVIAAGGGLPVTGNNAEKLAKAGHIVWLDCSPRVLVERRREETAAEQKATRLALTDLPLEEEIHFIYNERRPAYRAAANATIDTSHLSLPEVVRELEHIWRELTHHHLR